MDVYFCQNHLALHRAASLLHQTHFDPAAHDKSHLNEAQIQFLLMVSDKLWVRAMIIIIKLWFVLLYRLTVVFYQLIISQT